MPALIPIAGTTVKQFQDDHMNKAWVTFASKYSGAFKVLRIDTEMIISDNISVDVGLVIICAT